MLEELKRHNYVTPTNYLELVSGYKVLLAQKREEIGNQVKKLRNGLFKIDDTREKVEKMSVELEDAKVKVAAFQKQCDEYLVTLVQQKKQLADSTNEMENTQPAVWGCCCCACVLQISQGRNFVWFSARKTARTVCSSCGQKPFRCHNTGCVSTNSSANIMATARYEPVVPY